MLQDNRSITKSQLLSNKNADELEEKYSIYSEGNIYLKNTLIKLNEMGYSTFACCTGHIEEIYNHSNSFYQKYKLNPRDKNFIKDYQNKFDLPLGYIGFILPNESDLKILGIIEEYARITGNKIKFARYESTFNYLSCIITFPCNKVDESLKIFNKLLDSDLRYNSPVSSKMLNILRMVKNSFEDLNLSFSFKIQNDQYKFFNTDYFTYWMKCLNRNINALKALKIKKAIILINQYFSKRVVSKDNLLKCLSLLENMLFLIINNPNNKKSFDFYPNCTYEELLECFFNLFDFKENEFTNLIQKKNNYQKDIYDNYLRYYDEFLKYQDSIQSKKVKLKK